MNFFSFQQSNFTNYWIDKFYINNLFLPCFSSIIHSIYTTFQPLFNHFSTTFHQLFNQNYLQTSKVPHPALHVVKIVLLLSLLLSIITTLKWIIASHPRRTTPQIRHNVAYWTWRWTSHSLELVGILVSDREIGNWHSCPCRWIGKNDRKFDFWLLFF